MYRGTVSSGRSAHGPDHGGALAAWQEAEAAEMEAVARTLSDWQRDAGLNQLETARAVAPFMPPDLRKGATNGTLSRWQHPRNVRVAKFVVLRSVVEGLNHSMRELVEEMDAAREESLARHYGVPVDEMRDERRRQAVEEAELLRDWRSLDDSAQRVVRLQVRGLAREAQRARRLADEARAASVVAEGMPRTTDDADAALHNATSRVDEWAQQQEERQRSQRQRGQRSSGQQRA